MSFVITFALVCLVLGLDTIIRDVIADFTKQNYGPDQVLFMKEEINSSFGELPTSFGKHWESIQFSLSDNLDVEMTSEDGMVHLSEEGGAYLSTSFRTQKISARPSAVQEFISRLKTSARDIFWAEMKGQPESFDWDMVFTLPDELLPSSQMRALDDSTQAILLGKGDLITGVIPQPMTTAPIQLPWDMMPQPLDPKYLPADKTFC